MQTCAGVAVEVPCTTKNNDSFFSKALASNDSILMEESQVTGLRGRGKSKCRAEESSQHCCSHRGNHIDISSNSAVTPETFNINTTGRTHRKVEKCPNMAGCLKTLGFTRP